MKYILAIFVLTFNAFNLSAQTTRNVGDFTAIRVFDKIHVTLINAEETKVDIEGVNKENVQIINKNGELKIRMSTLNLLKGNDVEVKVYYKNLNDIQANEGAVITSKELIETSFLSLNAKEGAQIDIKTNTQKISGKINSGGIISISGNTKTQDILITSGGIYNAKQLISEQADVTINAGGVADIYVSEIINAKTRAGGNINIYGNPKKINDKSFAGGTIVTH